MTRSFALVTALAMILGFVTVAVMLQKRWPMLAVVAEEKAEQMRLAPRNWDFWTLEMGALSEELIQEKEAQRIRKQDLEALSQRIQSEKAELQVIRDQITAIRNELNDSVITLLEAEKPNLKTLSRSYAAMKPAEAAPILRHMNDEMLVKLLALMKPDVVASILTQMAALKPEAGDPPNSSGSARAAKISEKLRLLKQEPSQENAP